MKKILLFGLIAVVAVSAFILYGNRTTQDNLLLSNAEALTDGELPDGWVVGQTMDSYVRRHTGDKYYYINNELVWIPIIEDISCCVDATEHDACNQSNEDSRC